MFIFHNSQNKGDDMKKTIFKFIGILVLFVLFGGTSHAAGTYSKIGMRNYSTANPTTCTVIGGSWGLTKSNEVVPVFNPIPSTIRVVDLGTKGFANYSAFSLGAREVHITCFQTATPQTPVYVKLYFDDVETSYFTTTNAMFFVQP